MLWIGLFVAALGGLFLYLSRSAATKVMHMKGTETARIGNLLEVVKGVREEMGGGPSELREFTEIKGVVGCDRPILAEMSGQEAAVVQNSVTRQVEELKEVRDSNGNVSTRWEKRSETVSSNRLEAPFWIDDGSGRIEVRPGGAEMTLQQVVDRFEQPSAVEQGGGRLSFGRASFSFSSLLGPSSRLRVIGYRFQESILPIGVRVYALGETSDTSDGFALHKPSEPGKPFIISTKSEEELVAAGASQAKWMRIGGFGAIGLGVVLILVGAVKMVTG